MTTLIVTHANGFTSCFTKHGDALPKQRALIDTGDDGLTPEALAEFANDLANQYGWLSDGPKGILSGMPYSNSAKPAPIALPKAKRPTNGDLQPNEPTGNDRLNAITIYLSDNPNATIREIIEGCGLIYETRISGRWNHYLRKLIDQRTVKCKRIANTGYYSLR
jgi:hypothetical protein